MKRLIENLLDLAVRPVSRARVFAWWRSSGARHRRTQVIAAFLLAVSLMTNAMPALAAPCSFTEDGNGDVIIAANCEIAAGTYGVTRDFIINSGVTVTAQADTGLGTGVIINAGRHITISSTAVLTADNQGFTQELGPGAGNNTSHDFAGSGGGHGGEGGEAGFPVNTRGATYGSVIAPVTIGSGGGDDEFAGNQGGAGGGAIKLVATSGTVTVSGTVSANGQNGVGSGDGGGGSGGSVWIDAGTLAGTGTIRANGGSGLTAEGGGGGGGGRIAITYVTGTPTSYALQAFGGTGGNQGGFEGEDGGAGTVYLKAAAAANGDIIIDNNNRTDSAPTTQVSAATETYANITIRNGTNYRVPSGFTFSLASGGVFTGGGTVRGTLDILSGGTYAPPLGTTAISNVDLAGAGSITNVTDLTLSNSRFTFTGAFLATLANLVLSTGADWVQDTGTVVPDDLTVQTGATWTQNHASTITFDTVVVESGGTITHCNNSSAKTCEVDILAATFTVNSGGIVSGDALGYDNAQGPGAGIAGANSGGGGGHGGSGGEAGSANTSGAANDSVTAPTDLGSGGGNDGSAVGGVGGGAVRIDVSGTFTNNGTITVNGTNAPSQDAGGGAGGSVYVTAPTVTGNGTIRANGGAAVSIEGGGGGAGGRIAAYYTTNTATYTYQAFGGEGGNQSGFAGDDGGAGTVYLKAAAAVNGDLIVKNNNKNTSSATPQITTASQTYDNITIADGAKYLIPNAFTLALATGGTFITGGTQRPTIQTDAGGTFTLPSTLPATISNINVTNNGTFNPPASTMTVSSSIFANGGSFNAVTNLTVNSSSAFTHTGTYPATLTNLSVTGSSTYTHSGSGMSITDGANFTLNGASSFLHDSSTGFATGLSLIIAATFIAEDASFDDQASLTVQSGGTFEQRNLGTIDIGTLTVQSGGALTHTDNSTSKLYAIDIASTTIDIQTGGVIGVDGRGFDSEQGAGQGNNNTNSTSASGAGYGGNGGGGASNVGGVTYGSVTQPTDIGSGGGNDGNPGSSGGGAIKLAASGTFTLNGTITADGGPQPLDDAGAGSGGSVWIDAGTLAGTGSISTIGGDAKQSGGEFGGGGGGGRVAIHYTSGSPTGYVVSAAGGNEGNASCGGTSCQDGGAGTIYLKAAAAPNGDLIVRNANLLDSAFTTQVVTASQTYDNITVADGAEYRIPSTFTLTLATGGAFTGGGTQKPTLQTDSGGTFDPNASTFSFTNLNVTNSGAISDVTSLTVSGSAFTHGVTGTFPATVSALVVTAASVFTHQGAGLSITNGANFTLNGASTFLHDSSTGFATGLSLTIAATFIAEDASFDDQAALTVASGGTFEQRNLQTIDIGTFTVQSGGAVTHTDNSTSKLYAIDIASTTIDLQAGSSVDVDNKGFDQDLGTGAGNNTLQSSTASGGSYGGLGGTSGPNVAASPYGSVTQPTDIGSGGGNDGSPGTSGGGAIKFVVSGTFTNNGTISASVIGNSGDDAGGGSGGSVWLQADALAGTGTIRANGGAAGTSGNFGGGGGGGRVAIHYTSGNPLLYTLQATGGARGLAETASTTDGGAGTVYLKAAAAANGDLLVKNGNRTNANFTTQAVTASQTYDNITIADGAKYRIPSTFTLTLAASGTFTSGGTVTPTLQVDSGGTFDPNKTTMAVSSIHVTLSGAFSDVTDLTYSNGTFTNGSVVGGGLTTLTLGSGANWIQSSTTNPFSGSTLTVQNGATFTQGHTSVITVGTVVVESGGTITHADNTTTKTANVNFSSTTFTVQSGGTVTGNSLGFDGSEGTGQGTDAATAGGGGYGGAGGNGSTPGAGGAAYGSNTNPVDLGSGGGTDTGGGTGGAGGGEIRLSVSGTVTVDGTISVNGQAGTANQAGGGAGGTVRIDVGVWAGAGTGAITANGGGGSLTTSATTGGGGGGGGRIAIYYASKTYSGTCTTNGGNKGGFGGTSLATAGAAGTCYEEVTAAGPSVTVVSHSPASPTTTDTVTLSGTATDDDGVTKIEIFLDGTNPENLKHTCTFSPAQTPANCSINVGTLAYGPHTTTIRATDIDSATGTSSENFSVSGSTLASGLRLGRLKAGATNVSFSLSFTLQGASSGTLTVTFPVGFTVTQAPSGVGSSACLSSFGSTSSTMTATKTNCTGTVVLAGGLVTNPATTGFYKITWSNDFGEGGVYIVDDDQVTVSGDVEPQLTFNVGSQTAACDGTFSGSGGGLGLGALTSAAVASSDVSSVPHVCTRVTSNAGLGAVVSVRSAFGALQSASTPADQIVSATTALVAGTAGYGMCVGSSGGDTGRDATTPAGALPAAAAPFNGSCSTSAHSVGALTASFQSLWSLSGPSQNAFARIFLKAAVSPATPAHADYQDVLTFIATGTY